MKNERNDEALSNYTRTKVVIWLLILLALVTLLIMAGCGALPQTSGGDGDSTDNVAAVSTQEQPTQEAYVPPTNQPESGTNVTWDTATTDVEAGTLLMSGLAEPNTTVNVLIEGASVGTITASPGGSWELETPLRDPGRYQVIIQMLDSNNEVLGDNIRELEIPADAVLPTSEQTDVSPPAETPESESTAEVAEPTVVPTDVPTENSAEEAPAEEATEAESTETDQPESETAATDLAQPSVDENVDLTDFTGGIVTLNGNSTPNSQIEIVVNDGESELIDPVATDDAGNWTYTQVITKAADYTISARNPGEAAEPAVSFTVPDVTYATDGNCLSGVPPFGTIAGDTYIVAPCEYFSLIAERLQVRYQELLDANPEIQNVERIDPGDAINIP